MIFKRLIKQSTKQNSYDAGFTIIEVLIAIVILAVGILGLSKMQITSINANNVAGKYTDGSTRGVSEIENIMATAYDDASLVNGTTGNIVQGIYTVNWTITDSVPIPNVKNVNMIVTWNIKGQAKSFTTNYYKAVTF
ncbi:prepilin-type N-terminal cleavage/methylation domain-containing protein [Desulfobacterales bacterium HSG17]|nr:prepilin-type N-terminal cleavage/methylation domain-containing protein [Desulfobacterales bacterium HSG17]